MILGTTFVFDEKDKNAIIKWLSEIDTEISYWDDWFKTKGLLEPEEYLKRTKDKVEFAYPELIAGKENVKILDVGSGPISGLGNVAGEIAIQLSACDPLAFIYKEMIDKAGIKPYVLSEFAMTERLCDAYPRDSFDIVNMTNALDHAINPLLGVYNMLAICKKGGSVVLHHRENEAEFEYYSGLHKWNISENSGNLIFWNKSEYINVTDKLGENAEVSVSRRGDGTQKLDTYIFVNIIKKGECDFSAAGLNVYDKILTQIAFYTMSTRYRKIASNESIIKKLRSLNKFRAIYWLANKLRSIIRRHRGNTLVSWCVDKLKPILMKNNQ